MILFGLIVHSTVLEKEPINRLLLALGLIPFMRIVSLTVPVGEIAEIYWYLIVAVPIMVSTYMIIRRFDLRWEDIGFTLKFLPIQAVVALMGLYLGALDYAILEPESLIDELTFQEALLPALILLIATGLVEELVFRGVLQRTAQSIASWGWIYIAALYAVLQIGHGSVEHCLFILGVALFYGWIVYRTGSIVGVSLSHGLLNVSLYLISPHIL